MAGRIRAWRSAFGALRRGSTDATAVQDFLIQAPALARSAHELSAAEVVGDIVLLLEVVAKLNDAESRNVSSRVCRLVADVTGSAQLEYKPTASALQVCQFLREMVERYRPVSTREASNEVVVEAVSALGYFINVNGQNLPSEEVNAVLLGLVPLINLQYNLSKDARTRKGGGYDFVFVAVSNIFTRAGTLITEGTWRITVQAFRKLLDHISSQLLEDASASRYYATVLRSLHLVLSDAKGSLDENVGGLVSSLRVFIGYGLSPTRSKNLPDFTNQNLTPTSGSNEKTKGSSLYRPPHLRARLADNAESSSNVEETEKRAIWSDSEQSDNDGFEPDNFRSSKARTNAILSILAIARADPKSLHAHWSLLLPTHNVLLPRMYQPTLLSSLLFDPASKTRVAAASAISAMLEGPARAFFQVAEYRDSGKTSSYTTLSGSLGQMIVELYRGLLHSVSNESHSGVLLAVFKSLSLLVSSSPFDRLPQRLLCDAIKTVHKKISELSGLADQTIAVSGLSCLSAVLSVSTGFSDVVELLLSDKGEKSLLLDLVSLVRAYTSSGLRIESLQALKAAIHSHPSLASIHWSTITELVLEVIRHEIESRHEDDKTVYHSVKLLDESLRAVSGFKGAEDIFDIPISSPAPSLLPQPTKLLTVSERPPNNMSIESEVLGHSHWDEALETLLPLTLQHSAPMVRAAALTCFAGLTTAVYSSLSEAYQTYILTTVIEAAVKDGTPSVRTAACRALGVIVSCPEVVEREERIISAVTTVQGTISDAALSVRITSSWALANICDAFCKSSEKGYPSESETLNGLAEIALKATKDSDKVRANAVRALGNLAKFVDFAKNGSGPCVWLGRMVQSFVSCITTGNVKVQWNVCHALGNLFLNRSIFLSKMPWSSSVFSILLLLLRDSGNFKIRIHAASALAVPSSRNAFGESYGDVLRGLVHGLESLDSEERSPPASFKYISTLSEQLTNTCLRVLSFALPEDYDTLKDFFHRRATFLHNWLRSIPSATSSYGGIESNHQIKMELASRAARVLSGLFEYGGDRNLQERFHSLKLQ